MSNITNCLLLFFITVFEVVCFYWFFGDVKFVCLIHMAIRELVIEKHLLFLYPLGSQLTLHTRLSIYLFTTHETAFQSASYTLHVLISSLKLNRESGCPSDELWDLHPPHLPFSFLCIFLCMYFAAVCLMRLT